MHIIDRVLGIIQARQEQNAKQEPIHDSSCCIWNHVFHICIFSV